MSMQITGKNERKCEITFIILHHRGYEKTENKKVRQMPSSWSMSRSVTTNLRNIFIFPLQESFRLTQVKLHKHILPCIVDKESTEPVAQPGILFGRDQSLTYAAPLVVLSTVYGTFADKVACFRRIFSHLIPKGHVKRCSLKEHDKFVSRYLGPTVPFIFEQLKSWAFVGQAKRAFAPLEIETKHQDFLENTKLAAQFRSINLIFAMPLCLLV